MSVGRILILSSGGREMGKTRERKRIVGDYELIEILGEGAFGKVWRANNVVTNAVVAVKILSKQKIEQENMGAQIKKEISILKLISHPHVVQVLEVISSRKRIFMVQELVDGGELFDKIVESQKFDEDTSRFYFQQLCVGTEYCHRQGICHRDLKPENLLLDKDGNLKITDFGLSALIDLNRSRQHNILRTSCGTPNYVAPEVIANRGYDGIRSDTWSIGVILFVFGAGFLPFDEPDMNLLFRKITRADYYVPRWFSDDLVHILSKILVPSPTKRYTITDLTTHHWWMEGGPYKDIHKTSRHVPAPAVDNNLFENEAFTNSQRTAREEGPSQLFVCALTVQQVMDTFKSNLEILPECISLQIDDLRMKAELNIEDRVLRIKAILKVVNKKPTLTMIKIRKVSGEDKDFKFVARLVGNFMAG